MVRERDDMIECLSSCRVLDQEYESIFQALEKLDQNVRIGFDNLATTFATNF
jgi:hypothetical protein